VALRGDQAGVKPLAGQELGVAVDLGPPLALQDDDADDTATTRKPMNNQQGCSPGPQTAHGGLQQALIPAVQIGHRLVRNQDRRILQEGAHNRNAPALATGALSAAYCP
jgi:hypothetical protein